MYVPEAFRERDRAVLLAHAASNPFATVITAPSGASPEVSHLPLLIDPTRGVLRGHLARENPQFTHFAAGAEALVVFHGPHGYVSPSVYAEPGGVPTWNYVVVHVRGRARLVDEAGLREILQDTAVHFDTTGWRPQALEPESMSPRLAAIAGFEVDAQQVDGKWKLSQNRSYEDQARVTSWLETGDDQSRALARIMRQAAPLPPRDDSGSRR